MTTGFIGWKEDQSVLYDTNNICYGLHTAGYLSFYTSYGYWVKRSAQLPPYPKNYMLVNFNQPIYAIAVSNWIAPVVFITGHGSPCGDVVVNGIKYFLFVGASTSTKAYVFDRMTDVPTTGFKHWRESDGTLIFNGGQPPLNIVQTSVPPPDRAPEFSSAEFPNMTDSPYVGSTNGWLQNDSWAYGAIVAVPITAGVEYAASINFTRQSGMVRGYGSSGAGGALPTGKMSAQEYCVGYNGGVYWGFTVTTGFINDIYGNNGSFFYAMPRDRRPSAAVIRTSDYPFPFTR
ncbi:MAG: hypothetical protein DI616_15620 [Paracoccus denitrificans]|uniref:Uncharacterized protein n=1 Tax=Paracoccus denitrificans TaxID=266 RepID=A0A533I460_PARDE|nr:MAG: hypothetical protein DI616_15620 [Paracoccus denitrificans]